VINARTQPRGPRNVNRDSGTATPIPASSASGLFGHGAFITHSLINGGHPAWMRQCNTQRALSRSRDAVHQPPPSEMRLPRGSPYQRARWSSGALPSSGVPTTTASNPSCSTNWPRSKVLMDANSPNDRTQAVLTIESVLAEFPSQTRTNTRTQI
jgi:hypothetical protein